MSQQVLFLTNDADVATWARAEAIAGNLALIEPTASAESTSTLQPETVDLR